MTAPEQPLVLVGSYAEAEQPGIHLFHFDDTSGALIAAGACAGITNPSFVAAHPSQPWIYAVSETSAEQDGSSGSVWALRFERDSANLERINHQPSAGDAPCHVQLDPSGSWLLAANYGSGSVVMLPILADGSLGEQTDLVQHSGSSVDPQRQAGPHAHSSAFTPDQRFVVVADLGLDQLVVYAFDSTAGKLNLHTRIATQPGAGPRHIAFHPGGRFAYVANELNNTVSLYDYDAAQGIFHERQVIATVPPGYENSAADIHISPSGTQLYVSNRGHNSIVVFDVADDGRLAQAALVSCGGSWPRHFALTPDGERMLIANQHSGDVSVLPLSAGAEPIGDPVARTSVSQASCVALYHPKTG